MSDKPTLRQVVIEPSPSAPLPPERGDRAARVALGFFAAGLVSALVAAGAVIAGLAQIDGSIPDDVEGPIEALLVAKANIALFGFAAFVAVALLGIGEAIRRFGIKVSPMSTRRALEAWHLGWLSVPVQSGLAVGLLAALAAFTPWAIESSNPDRAKSYMGSPAAFLGLALAAAAGALIALVIKRITWDRRLPLEARTPEPRYGNPFFTLRQYLTFGRHYDKAAAGAGMGLLWLAVVAQAGTEFTTGDGLSRLVATFIVWGAGLALIGLVGATRFWMETPAAADAPQTQNAGPEGPAS